MLGGRGGERVLELLLSGIRSPEGASSTRRRMLGQGGCVVGGGADREEMEGEETGSRTGRCVVLKDEKQWGIFL